MPVPPKKALSRPLLRDVVYDRLLEAIVTGSLHPGEVLREQEIERWTGASRTPVRQAIDRLASIELVETIPRRETRVAPISYTKIAEMLTTLGALYTDVVRECVPLLTRDDIERLRSCSTALDASETPDGYEPLLATDLFDVFVRRYGNVLVMRVRDRFMPHIRRLENQSVEQGPRMHPSEVESLVTAAATGEAGTAADLVDRYFSMLAEHVSTLTASRPEETAS